MAKTKTADISDVSSDEVKLVEAKAAEKKAAKKTKKDDAPKAEKKSAEKKTEKKSTTKAAKAPAVKAVVEYQGIQVNLDDIVAAVKVDWTGETIKTLEIYVKPEDAAAYYVVNGTETGKVNL